MPYIEVPNMEWTVNGGLYHRFLKWHLKCENILGCELCNVTREKAMQEGNCMEGWFWHGPVCFQELVQWKANAWYNLGEVWRVLQASNKMKWGLGLIFSQTSGKETSQWMSGIMLSRPRLLWLSTPKMAKILHGDIFWFFLKGEEFVSKAINDSSIDLDKFPASRSGNLQRWWRIQRWLPGISSKWQVTPRWLKLILCDSSSQNSQQANTRRRSLFEA